MKPPHGLIEIISAFGDPRLHMDDHAAWEAEAIASFDLPYPLSFCDQPVRKIRTHKLVGEILVSVFDEILKSGLVEDATEYGGCYNFRAIRGMPRFISTHTWGIAIDLNPSANPLGGEADQNEDVVAIFKGHGFTWGGEFINRKDPMHFQFASGY